MAKINELSDTQLEKALIQYSDRAESDPSEKNKKLLQQLQLERKKRQTASKSSPQEESEFASLSRSAEAAVIKKRKEQDKKNKGKLRGKLPTKGAAPAIDTNKGNLILMSGLASGALGLILLADDFLLHFIPAFPFKMALYGTLIVLGLGASKASAFLSDDNR